MTGSLSAAPPAEIESVDLARYPEVRLRISGEAPYPPFVLRGASERLDLRFSLREIHNEEEYVVASELNADGPNPAASDGSDATGAPQLIPLRLDAGRLDLVLVIDSTKSVPEQSFRRQMEAARRLVLGLQPEDRVALYALEGEPELKAEFTREHERVASLLESIKRDGDETRIYDALYSGVYTARAAHDGAAASEPYGAAQSVTILFTDGRDEGSYLTDNDSYELSELGRRLAIPIHIALFGEGEGSGTAPLQRLALKSGGALHANLAPEKFERLGGELRRLRRPLYELRYRSPAAEAASPWPGQEVLVRLSMRAGESEYSDIAAYQMPLFFTLRDVHPLWIAAAVLLALLVLLLLFVLILALVLRARRNRETETRSRALVERATRFGEHPEARAYPEPPDAMFAPAGPDDFATSNADTDSERREREAMALAAGEGPDDFGFILADQENRTGDGATQDIYAHDAQDPAARAGGYGGTRMREPGATMPPPPAGVLMDDERKLYMREYAYRLTQMALRDAPRYQRAGLDLERPGQPEREYDLFLDTTIIGSGRWSNIALHDPSVSPVHAKIKKIDGRFVVYDLLSATGVYHNGRKLLRPRALRDGDELRIGRALLRFRGA